MAINVERHGCLSSFEGNTLVVSISGRCSNEDTSQFPVRTEAVSRRLTAWQSLERQGPQSQGSTDHDDREAYYHDNEAKDYDVRIGSRVPWVTHGASIAPRASVGNSPFR